MTGYNGYTNYATWRIKLEIFDDDYGIVSMMTGGADDIEQAIDWLDADCLQSFADEIIFGEVDASNTLIVGYANAFLDDVDWRQISELLTETLTDDPEQFGFEGDDDDQ
jgi:hypothetical protein